ncbi:DUF2917 domain-containing protein [Rhodoferax sp.]|uniref:DUF2917 domain-containing protein n=1 Tax=Rhodoferax sp. TaxID=50421 RepID=UPI002ACE44B6|nr:DUF2917 domain-containing protein [Rhodoferax sp.]MDZ7921293.1 DUF2917 domain-containing protein [Rhodoferax sp.]
MSVHSPSSQPSLSEFASAALSGPSLAAPQEHSAELKLDAEALAMDEPWVLPKGRAVTVRPRTAGVLRVVSGRAWATLDVSRHTPLTESGDHFVALGHDLQLRAGQRVVVEAWPYKGQDGIQLQWVAQPQACLATRFQTKVVEPVRDIGHGLALVARALWRLLGGLAGYSDFLTAGRGRVLRGLESNAP